MTSAEHSQVHAMKKLTILATVLAVAAGLTAGVAGYIVLKAMRPQMKLRLRTIQLPQMALRMNPRTTRQPRTITLQ